MPVFRVTASLQARRRLGLTATLVREIVARHAGEPMLIMAMDLDQIRHLARELDIPVITGATPQDRRDRLYEQFRDGELTVVALSKVGNFAVDLPDALVAVQVSGTFGSRQEEAQRLGRILRPKPGLNQAHFDSLVSRDTVEQGFALRRQRFLCEQGNGYRVVDESLPPDVTEGSRSGHLRLFR